MVNDDNGKASPYPGPEGADSDEELLDEEDGGATEGSLDPDDVSSDLPVDEDEEPSPGNAV